VSLLKISVAYLILKRSIFISTELVFSMFRPKIRKESVHFLVFSLGDLRDQIYYLTDDSRNVYSSLEYTEIPGKSVGILCMGFTQTPIQWVPGLLP
jgi:hypothetical protein